MLLCIINEKGSLKGIIQLNSHMSQERTNIKRLGSRVLLGTAAK